MPSHAVSLATFTKVLWGHIPPCPGCWDTRIQLTLTITNPHLSEKKILDILFGHLELKSEDNVAASLTLHTNLTYS